MDNKRASIKQGKGSEQRLKRERESAELSIGRKKIQLGEKKFGFKKSTMMTTFETDSQSARRKNKKETKMSKKSTM